MKQGNLKQALISILIGACVAFLSSMFEGLANFFSTHSTEIISGISGSIVYLSKNIRV